MKLKGHEVDANALHRNGQRGCITQPDANGFVVFTSETGAVFSSHICEIVLDGYTPLEQERTRARWRSWPDGTLRLAVEQQRGASNVFIVARTAPGVK